MGGGNEERGVLIDEKSNQGVRERKKVGIHCIAENTDTTRRTQVEAKIEAL
jgi:hypothetical protein